MLGAWSRTHSHTTLMWMYVMYVNACFSKSMLQALELKRAGQFIWTGNIICRHLDISNMTIQNTLNSTSSKAILIDLLNEPFIILLMYDFDLSFLSR